MPVGNYGTNYVLRAIVDQYGLAGLPPNISIYPIASTERHGVPLNASTTRYVAHFPASDFPVPVQAFWSMTMYTTSGYFAANPLERFTVGDRSDLHYNEDGSLDVYLQNEEPTTETSLDNWLPAPDGPFQLIMRLYGVNEADITPIFEGAPGAGRRPRSCRAWRAAKPLPVGAAPRNDGSALTAARAHRAAIFRGGRPALGVRLK